MDNQLLLSKLHRIACTLKPGKETTDNDLITLHRKLTEYLLHNPGLTVYGTRLHHDAVEEPEALADLSMRFAHVNDLLQNRAANGNGSTPLIFKRDTAFRNNFLGNSVPAWGTGMAVTHTYGPFIDEHGLDSWFDFFEPTRMVNVFIQGQASPVLLIPVWGTLTGRQSYRIEAGSVWIASQLIANTPALQGYYTGLKIKGGTLELGANATGISCYRK